MTRRPSRVNHAAAAAPAGPPPATTTSQSNGWPSLTAFMFANDIARQAPQPDIVFLADVLLDLAFFVPDNIQADGPGLGVRARIVNGRFVTQGVEIRSRVPFNDMQEIGMGIADQVNPAALVEADDVHDQGVAFPASYRVAEPCGVQSVAFRMPPAVHVDDAPEVGASLVDHQDAFLRGNLEDLHGERRGHQPRSRGRQAIAF